MTFTVHAVEQRSEAWRILRLGRLTGSVAADMLARRKDGSEAAAYRNLKVRLCLERITGRSQENGYVSQAMQDGLDREIDASALYEGLTGHLLTSTGFLQHDTLMAGCSLDGHIGDFEGIIEIKSPIPATHLQYLRTSVIPGEYEKQILHNLWITGAQWADWLSYNPDFPEPLQSKLVRVVRDAQAIAGYEVQARAFLAEVQREYDEVVALAGAVA